jgi:hypothetical protein
MIDAKTKTMRRQFSSNKYLLLAIILIILLSLGLYGYNAFRTSQAASSQPGIIPITQSTLEEDYGLRVQLLAVTAAGGLVDLRLQIVDAEKAEALLSESTNIPALRVGDDVILRTSEDAAAQDIQFEDGKSIFVMFPNTGNILKPGDPVNIIFGDLQLETIQSK